MRHLNYLTLTMFIALHMYGQSVDLEHTPSWLNDVPSTPAWWSNVVVKFTNNLSESNCWLHIEKSESSIEHLAAQGISPIRERQELIKYIDHFETFSNLSGYKHKELKLKMASLYSRLGEHQRAAKIFAGIAKNDPRDWVPLQELAQECERAGENEYALQIYIHI